MADSLLGNVGTGAMKGAALGAKLGTIVPGVGNAVGAIGGALIGGLGAGVKAKKLQNQKEDALGFTPGFQDPTQVQRLAQIDQIAKNIQSGTDAATQTAINQGAETTAATQNRLARVTGGNSGATVDALIKAQRAGGDASNTAIAQAQSRLPFFMDLGQQLANRIEQRDFDLGMLNRGQNLAEWAQGTQDQNINRNAIAATGIGQDELGAAGGDAQARIQALLAKLKMNQDAGNVGTGAGGSSASGAAAGLGISPEVAQGFTSFMNQGI